LNKLVKSPRKSGWSAERAGLCLPQPENALKSLPDEKIQRIAPKEPEVRRSQANRAGTRHHLDLHEPFLTAMEMFQKVRQGLMNSTHIGNHSVSMATQGNGKKAAAKKFETDRLTAAHEA
jgi:hypothetical protein